LSIQIKERCKFEAGNCEFVNGTWNRVLAKSEMKEKEITKTKEKIGMYL